MSASTAGGSGQIVAAGAGLHVALRLAARLRNHPVVMLTPAGRRLLTAARPAGEHGGTGTVADNVMPTAGGELNGPAQVVTVQENKGPAVRRSSGIVVSWRYWRG